MKSKIILAVGVILAFLVIITLVNGIGLARIQESQSRLVSDQFSTAVNLVELRSFVNRTQVVLLEMMSTTDPTVQQTLSTNLGTVNTALDQNLQELDSSQTNPDVVAKLQAIKTAVAAYRADQNQEVAYIQQGNPDAAKALALNNESGGYEKLRTAINDLQTSVTAAAQGIVDDNAQTTRGALIVTVIMGVLALIVGMAITRFIIVSLRRITSEMQEGIGVLATSANEIVTATTQVAAGAAETATAVSQTTTTVEEVRQTAQVSHQKARYVVESAQKAEQATLDGTQAVTETIDGMNRIRLQMGAIADSVVRLSDQSRTISDIISTVNDLADQSNLLAVNAAIEAAKAGEQGRGFGVVAQEIKSLAEQSRQATAQVYTILNDIQKSMSQAVMATEQGAKAVEAGSKLAEQSGEAVRLLTGSIVEASQAATQITASSQQQVIGMDQIAPAMESIKQASTQNVASTHQSQQAAQNLYEVGQRLKLLVEQFNA